MNENDIRSLIDSNTNLSDETKSIISILFPTLIQMEKVTENLHTIIDNNIDTKLIKEILINDVIEGKSDKGLVGSINDIEKVIKISDKARNEQRIHTIEDLIMFAYDNFNTKYHLVDNKIDNIKNEIINEITQKTPWYKTLSHIKDLFLTISILTIIILNLTKIIG